MGNLVDDLLELARINRAKLDLQPLDLRTIAARVIEEARANYAGARIDLAPLPAVDGDPVLVRQMLANLIGNALKYSSQKAAPVVEIGWDEAQRACYVRDNGVGFDMNYAHKLFGTFERLHAPEEFEGTGIGLAIVKRVVERHGGRVWANARPGEGATFFFALTP